VIPARTTTPAHQLLRHISYSGGKGDEVDQILGQILRQAVWERLDLLDELAAHADAESLVSVARTEVPRLTDGWRALLAVHEPDSRGRCPECSRRWQPRRSPCSVWRTAHDNLVAVELMSPQDRRGFPHPLSRAPLSGSGLRNALTPAQLY
jgi:hypothetical protein